MEDETPSEELFSQLLSALAAGARAVQGLPLEDEFEYQSSFPEFRQLVDENKESLLDTLLQALEDYTNDSIFDNLDDPLLWETCADACDALLEHAEAHLRSDVPSNLRIYADTARQQAQSSFGRLLEGIVEMEKPQDVYQIHVNNDRLIPFVPSILEKSHAMTPLDLTLHPGHGLERRFGELRRVAICDSSIVAPSSHVPHVYETEITSLSYTPWQLESPKPEKINILESLEATWIDTPQALNDMGVQLESAREIALDLEAHSYRSFAGFVCLIQISYKDQGGNLKNFLIDPFPLWNQISGTLGPILANPEVVKVLHGADSDIQWLQRDFGLYVVNLFDTGRASRALRYSSAGYAYLLKRYVGVDADKTHQLSDWRQRPLPDAMRHYAIMDTHYLLDIYAHLKYDLSQHREASIKEVLDTSRQISLIRYAGEPFRSDGYNSFTQRRRQKTDLNASQDHVLRSLYDWRDQTARVCDESPQYVCSNQALLRLALSCPTNLSTLQGLLNPMPPLLLRYSKDILQVIQHCTSAQHEASTPVPLKTKATVGAPSSAFFKPANSGEDELRDRLLSPVLGTEALYMQAGWITPLQKRGRGPDFENQVVDVVTTTADEDEEGSDRCGDDNKPRHVLTVHEVNQKFRSSQFSAHSLQLRQNQDRERSADGMGAARAARAHVGSPHAPSIDEETTRARKAATHIHVAQKNQMIGLISPTTELDEVDDEEMATDEQDEDPKGTEQGEEEFVVPRSMREIYRISNRNRRNKKATSPTPERAGTPANERELEALAKAEEVLKVRGLEGKNYFDEIPGSPKRQRTKSTGTASLSSEDAQGHDSGSISREDDIGLMQEIGWINDKEEVDNILKSRRAIDGDEAVDPGDEDSEEEEARGSIGKPTKPSFDYSTIGPIGAFNPSAPQAVNPFFTGAAIVGGHLNQQFGKSEKKKQNPNKGKQSRRQLERPEKRDGRAQAYKKK